jgi:hypothetical protein
MNVNSSLYHASAYYNLIYTRPTVEKKHSHLLLPIDSACSLGTLHFIDKKNVSFSGRGRRITLD